jgi:hypothetical protein
VCSEVDAAQAVPAGGAVEPLSLDSIRRDQWCAWEADVGLGVYESAKPTRRDSRVLAFDLLPGGEVGLDLSRSYRDPAPPDEIALIELALIEID